MVTGYAGNDAISTVAKQFMLRGVQEWGQSEEDRIKATQAVLDVAGFDAQATCGPLFGGIWRKTCTGKDGEAASAFLKNLTDTLRRGKFEEEVDHVDKMIRERRTDGP